MIRVYVPADRDLLRVLSETGRVGPAPVDAYAVTADLRAEVDSDDDEELELAAMTAAAHHAARRPVVVIAADVPAIAVVAGDPGRVVVRTTVPLADVASFHVGGEPDQLGWYATQELPDLL